MIKENEDDIESEDDLVIEKDQSEE